MAFSLSTIAGKAGLTGVAVTAVASVVQSYLPAILPAAISPTMLGLAATSIVSWLTQELHVSASSVTQAATVAGAVAGAVAGSSAGLGAVVATEVGALSAAIVTNAGGTKVPVSSVGGAV